jgi:hypothetical protein
MITEALTKRKEKYLQKALENEVSALTQTTEGGRNNQLNASAFCLGQLIYHGLSENDAEDALLGACDVNGLLHEDGEDACRATIKSGLNDGQAQPRNLPDFDDDDDDIEVAETPYTDSIHRSWEEGKKESGHLYIENKKLNSLHGTRIGCWFDNGTEHPSLMIPLVGFHSNTLCSIQHIYYNKDGKCCKRFDGKYKDRDGFFLFGQPEKRIAVVEGFATGASIFEATGVSVAVAFTCSRIKTLAPLLRQRYPDAEIVIVSDLGDDEREKSATAAKAVNGRVFIPSLPDNETIAREETFTDANDLFRLFGEEELSRQWEDFLENTKNVMTGWPLAKTIAPRISFPWDILPAQFSQSLKQLGRSCATSAHSLPGMALAILATTLGRKVVVQAKSGWHEPLIIWVITIQETGDGKTPAMRKLTNSLENKQKQEHDRHHDELAFFESLPKEERGTPPKPPRGYFTTDFTFEALQSELEDHPTGGLLIVLNEASAIISSQNQYKAKGVDRESLLALHDGHVARVIRKGKSVMIPKACVQIVGGIQPKTFRDVFGEKGNKYLFDGTIFRCLYTYLPVKHILLNDESWNEQYHEAWHNTISQALCWADEQNNVLVLKLDASAQERFFQWRNNLDRKKALLPEELRGFLPKAYGYALRLSGAIHCLHAFYNGDTPKTTLTLSDVERGISMVMFYLGQAVDTIKLLSGVELKEDFDQTKILEALENGPLTQTDINKSVFKRHKSSDEIKETLKSLLAQGDISEKKTETTGRPKTTYCLVREKSELSEERLCMEPAVGLNSLNSLNSEGVTEEKDDGLII